MKGKHITATNIKNMHRLQIETEALQKIIECLEKTAKPLKVILFGSCAESRATTESDVDLLLVLDTAIDRKTKLELSSRLSKEVGIPVQLIAMLAETYMETRDVIGGIAYPATKYGVVIYEKS